MKFLLEYGHVAATEDPNTSPLAKLPGGLPGTAAAEKKEATPEVSSTPAATTTETTKKNKEE
jgi:hypothetical protein